MRGYSILGFILVSFCFGSLPYEVRLSYVVFLVSVYNQVYSIPHKQNQAGHTRFQGL